MPSAPRRPRTDTAPGGTNFTTWASAAAALSGGISGPGHTVFVVASTTFNEAVFLPLVAGTGPSSTLTFIAQGAPAVINAGGLQDAFTVDGAQTYLIFENLRLQGWTRYGLNVNGTSTSLRPTFCTFRKIDIDGPASASTSIIGMRLFYAQDCIVEDCTVRGGGYVMRSEQIVRTTFRRCEFDGKGLANSVLAPFNNNDADNRWENCFFHDCGPSGTGLNINLSSYGNMFWHNTVIMNTSGTAVFLGSLTSWSRASPFRNNIVVNWGTGTCITYGVTTSTTWPAGTLECNDADHNV